MMSKPCIHISAKGIFLDSIRIWARRKVLQGIRANKEMHSQIQQGGFIKRVKHVHAKLQQL